MRIKYPRTIHVPSSPGATSDDRILSSLSHFQGKTVVVTEKVDGENTTLYRDGFHARSIDSRHHPSRDWVAGFHAGMCWDIPENWRICGENLYAMHSIQYSSLPSFFLGFSVWDQNNQCQSWNDTVEFFDLLGITAVPLIYQGPFTPDLVDLLVDNLDLNTTEGLVMRLADSFNYDDFEKSVAKWVRPHHVTTDQHWMHRTVIPNKLGSR